MARSEDAKENKSNTDMQAPGWQEPLANAGLTDREVNQIRNDDAYALACDRTTAVLQSLDASKAAIGSAGGKRGLRQGQIPVFDQSSKNCGDGGRDSRHPNVLRQRGLARTVTAELAQHAMGFVEQDQAGHGLVYCGEPSRAIGAERAMLQRSIPTVLFFSEKPRLPIH